MKAQFKKVILVAACAVVLGLVGFSSGTAHAQEPRKWEFRASGYGYFPSLGGSTSFPTPNGGNIDIDSGTLIKNTNFAIMGAFEVQKGRWGGFADTMYFNIGNSQSDTQPLALTGVQLPLPPGVNADLSLDVKATTLTLAGNFRALSTHRLELDVIGGARLLDIRGSLDWAFHPGIGPFSGPAAVGSTEASSNHWDGIGGVKGRINLTRKWFIPYYADAGAGQSELTWQAMTGVGYSFRRFEAVAAWKYLSYDMKSGSKIGDLNFNGPGAGATFRF